LGLARGATLGLARGATLGLARGATLGLARGATFGLTRVRGRAVVAGVAYLRPTARARRAGLGPAAAALRIAARMVVGARRDKDLRRGGWPDRVAFLERALFRRACLRFKTAYSSPAFLDRAAEAGSTVSGFCVSSLALGVGFNISVVKTRICVSSVQPLPVRVMEPLTCLTL
jgi:hypothetical protein